MNLPTHINGNYDLDTYNLSHYSTQRSKILKPIHEKNKQKNLDLTSAQVLTHCDHMATEIWVNIGSGNGLLPDSTKPLPEPMLTDHQWSPMTFILGQFHKRCLNQQSLKSVWKITYLKFHSNLPGANELTGMTSNHEVMVLQDQTITSIPHWL